MSNEIKDLYATLHTRLEGVGNHLKTAMVEMQSASEATEAELRSKLSAAKAKVAETKADAEAAKARL